ncbi:metalloregulator ArsR/SmtB family transcription factor [Arthrobacter sp. M4]|uniref:helix-turn-helix transcriptional regulator n=1 Tax=Arthrobacter sp. M4 TaxID=218160 RepID=UPI001CDBC300|nr:transcriptional regulator [Arthrobacter sp. M4]MCA4134969.1 transcriptional regulator [Arthrobacter sp. M4]
MKPDPAPDSLSSVAVLGDASRRAVYEYVLAAGRESGREVGRDDVAAALGMVRSTAAFHLDRLAKEGLLAVSYRRLHGRTGPGSGRPTKMYSRAAGEISVSLPQRHYDLAGELLAAAIEDSSQSGRPVAESVQRVASAAGREIREAAEDAGTGLRLLELLAQQGYEPFHDTDGSILLRNCPFHRLARKHTDTVCGLNVGLLGALVERPPSGTKDTEEDDGGARPPSDPSVEGDAASKQNNRGEWRAVLDPAPDRCCVRLVPVRGPQK